jgi:regulator of sigma E protease
MLLSLIVFVLVFSLVVLAHELGHYVLARRSGIKVLEFGIGYPPRLKTLAVRDGVEITLNATPIGGFVRMLGEEDPSDPDSFASKSATVRISTLLAGAAMNLLLAALLFACVFMIGDAIPVGRVVVQSVVPNSPAERAGILPSDVILAIEDQQLRNTWELVHKTQAVAGREVSVTLARGDQELVVRLTPRVKPPPGEGAMGIGISMQEGYQVVAVRHPVWEAVPLGVREVWTVLVETIAGFARMFRVGFTPGDITGPVGIMQIGGAVAQTGLVNLMRFAAFLSVNLSIINLLPVPALDGGRIAFILLEKARGGKRFAPQQEGLVHLLGLLLLLAFTVVISYFDIVRIVSGGSLLP